MKINIINVIFLMACRVEAMVYLPLAEIELAIKSNDFNTLEKLFDDNLINANHEFQNGQFKGKSFLEVSLSLKCFNSVQFLVQNGARVKLGDIEKIASEESQLKKRKRNLQALHDEAEIQVKELKKLETQEECYKKIKRLMHERFNKK